MTDATIHGGARPLRQEANDVRDQVALAVAAEYPSRRVPIYERMYRRRLSGGALVLDEVARTLPAWRPLRWRVAFTAWQLRRLRRYARDAAVRAAL